MLLSLHQKALREGLLMNVEVVLPMKTHPIEEELCLNLVYLKTKQPEKSLMESNQPFQPRN